MVSRSGSTSRLVQLGLQLLAGTGGMYFAVLTGATFLRRKNVQVDSNKVRFAVVVPAHDEERVISRTLESLERMDYPRESHGVFVVADNCSDATAEVARRFRCTVWERLDPERRAKGYALDWAFERLTGKYDAIVVVDADSEADPQMLAQFARVYEPSMVLQGLDIQALGPSLSSTASYVASALQNVLKPQGRENLGLSAGLMGNGMCFPAQLLRDVPWRRFGLAEDSEYHLDLVLAGRRARFVPGARVEATSPGSFGALRSQRMRWERGRVDSVRRFARPLLARALKERDPRSLEAFVSIASPPFSLAVSAAVGCLALGLVRRSFGGILVGALGIVAPGAATLRALQLVRAPARVYSNLFALPLFVVWRTYITLRSLFGGVGEGWVRTGRSGEQD